MNPSFERLIVDALISEQLVEPADRERSLNVVAAAIGTVTRPETGEASQRAKMPRLVEIVSYLGGALVLAAGGLFFAQEWYGLGFGTRLTMLAVVSAVLGTAGAVTVRSSSRSTDVHQATDDSRRRLAGTLLTGAALAVACLVGLAVDHWVDSNFEGIYWPAVLGGAVGLLMAMIGYRLAPTVLGMLGMLAGLLTAVLSFASGYLDQWTNVVAVAMFLVGALWLAATEAGLFPTITVARFLGVATALLGAQLPVIEADHPGLGYVLTLIMVGGGIAAYLKTTAWPYLAVAVAAVTLVVPEAVSDWTEGSLGVIGAVLVTGITLLIASFIGYRLRARPAEGTGRPD
ncbi:DUF2157 domain-containing protein [Brevibacterium sp.]|uniref:DUF2157 domain-containing protein n=1 Tax=Brevibacterium sp. TaxID=1701 RepID=UPI002648797C|nr:DUF2157 domain-containing protein [Brevibacterium sp.]MDN6159101.1 DUF2157 domain-containing protein [Brevibacterium sp.]MDN6528928.1 DUF2157 domain-containing protein [Brevibacterium sp.]MDN6604852.1 DUF2157 domain-containing protein [Brevibacterium sp.]